MTGSEVEGGGVGGDGKVHKLGFELGMLVAPRHYIYIYMMAKIFTVIILLKQIIILSNVNIAHFLSDLFGHLTFLTFLVFSKAKIKQLLHWCV